MGYLREDSAANNMQIEKWLLEARRVTGKNYYRLVWELYYFAIVSGIIPEEYFRFRLYRPDISAQKRRSFKGGRKFGKWIAAAIKRRNLQNQETMDNKLLFADFCSAHGVGAPDHLALYSNEPFKEDIKYLDQFDVLRSISKLTKFLRNPRFYPIFGKPMDSERALGSFGATHFEKSTDCLAFSDGRKIPAKELAEEIVAKYGGGYLFQRHLKQHPILEKYFGSLPTIFRVNTVKQVGQKADIYFAWGKLSPKGHMSASAHAGERYSAPFDFESGRFSDLFSFYDFKFTRYQIYPETGMNCRGVEVPHWHHLRERLPLMHDALGDYPLLGWDIAITPTGPAILETNYMPGFNTSQQVLDIGIGDPSIRKIFKG